jgi:hypothetical protein
MALIKVCDQCRKEVKHYGISGGADRLKLNINGIDYKIDGTVSQVGKNPTSMKKDMDLCPKCFMAALNEEANKES